MPVTLRLATPDDAARCAFVHHTAWVETYGSLLPASFWETETLDARTQRWQTWLDGGVQATVAEISDGGTGSNDEPAIAGFAIAGAARSVGDHPPVCDAELYALYVVAAHHGSGIGQALLDAVLQPGAPAQLWVADHNPRARRFYEKNGFSPDGPRFTDDHFGELEEIRLVR